MGALGLTFALLGASMLGGFRAGAAAAFRVEAVDIAAAVPPVAAASALPLIEVTEC
ncbi:hypothetical protein [Azospirillum sp. B21]|uniref:hypothetical protein n=1 Tax=Azospirillum sp. B21 TaxID=2607496 RepID=UPI00165F2E7D|nr:hypothetical protein [Azospirillum sp. B21]